MIESRKFLCLVMILKNHASQIKATLKNILDHIPQIDYYLICNVGYTDEAIICEFFSSKGITGEIYHDETILFEHACKKKPIFVAI